MFEKTILSNGYLSQKYILSLIIRLFLVYPDGTVCVSILHAPGDDPMQYEDASERWSPVQSVEKILLSVVSMLAEPNDESGANIEASKMFRADRRNFDALAKDTVRKSLGL